MRCPVKGWVATAKTLPRPVRRRAIVRQMRRKCRHARRRQPQLDTPWRNLVNRCRILSLTKASQTLFGKLVSKKKKEEGGGYEKVDADRPSHVVFADPLGLNSRKTCVADES